MWIDVHHISLSLNVLCIRLKMTLAKDAALDQAQFGPQCRLHRVHQCKFETNLFEKKYGVSNQRTFVQIQLMLPSSELNLDTIAT